MVKNKHYNFLETVAEDVFDELLRIIKTGGLFVLSINEKFFYSKAIAPHSYEGDPEILISFLVMIIAALLLS